MYRHAISLWQTVLYSAKLLIFARYSKQIMQKTQNIRIEDFNYPLPDERIAKFPLSKRDDSKLLVYRKGEIEEHRFHELPKVLPADSLLVFNNTRVIQARLHFRKETGALIEVFCLEPLEPHEYSLSFQSTGSCSWLCLVGNLKKWKNGVLTQSVNIDGKTVNFRAERGLPHGNAHEVHFSWDDSDVTFATLLDHAGELPIPPYLNRETEESDKTTYQTVYSKIEGSVAAPTAGLHFTPEVLNKLKEKNIPTLELTLHVGAGTFKPVKSETLEGHEMHTEYISVSRNLIDELSRTDRRVIAVGTTSVRTLESLYYIGKMLEHNPNILPDSLSVGQWQHYPDIVIVGNKQTFGMIEGFYGVTGEQYLIKDGDFLALGRHKLRFYLTPMVHWPETMMTFDETDGILFSGDGFGCFGTLDGGFVDTRMNIDHYWGEMVRYYSNIVGKYGSPVQKALQKLGGLPISAICSTHGPVWTENITKVVGIYDKLSRYDADEGVVIAYGSMYGNTEQMAEAIAAELSAQGIKNIVMHNVSKSNPSYILAGVFDHDAWNDGP